MNLFYLRIIENYADLYNILFYVQIKKFIFLRDTFPVGTRRRFNVEAWLKFRREVVSTLIQR